MTTQNPQNDIPEADAGTTAEDRRLASEAHRRESEAHRREAEADRRAAEADRARDARDDRDDRRDERVPESGGSGIWMWIIGAILAALILIVSTVLLTRWATGDGDKDVQPQQAVQTQQQPGAQAPVQQLVVPQPLQVQIAPSIDPAELARLRAEVARMQAERVERLEVQVVQQDAAHQETLLVLQRQQIRDRAAAEASARAQAAAVYRQRMAQPVVTDYRSVQFEPTGSVYGWGVSVTPMPATTNQ